MWPMKRLNRFRDLEPRHRWLALKSLGLLMAVRLGLVGLPFATVRGLLGRLSVQNGTRSGDPFSVDELTWAVRVGARYVPRATCLVRALALQFLLARSGYEAELRIGVAKEEGILKAHAWVDSAGRELLQDTDPDRFAPLLGGR